MTNSEEIRKLAARLTGMEKQIKGLSRPQLSYSVIEGGAIIAKDDDGNPRLRIGLQDDDTHAVVYIQGPVPPRPSAPVVTVDGVVITARHDGGNVGGVPLPADYRRRIVYAGLLADLSDAQMVATIEPPQGGDAVFMSPGDGTVYVAVRTESYSGQLSEFSPIQSVEVTMVSLEGEFEVVKQSANGKNSVNYSPTEPESGQDGDVWFDTTVDPATGQPKWTLHVWDEGAGSWVSAQDSRIATLASAYDGLAKELDAVVVSAAGSNHTYYSSVPPNDRSVLREGDLWFDTSPLGKNEPHRWSGLAWVSVADMRVQALESTQKFLGQTLATVKASADRKSTIYRQANKPTGTEYNWGDLWFDTSPGGLNKPYAWSGSEWVSVADMRVDAVEDAQTALATSLEAVRMSADGKSTITWSTSLPGSAPGHEGDTWFRTAGNNIIGYWSHDGTGWVERTLDPVVIPNLDAGKITSGYLDAARIEAGSITVDKLLVGSGTNLLVTDGWRQGREQGTLPGRALYGNEALLLTDQPGIMVRIKPGTTDANSLVFVFRRMSESTALVDSLFMVRPGESYRFTTTLGLAGTYSDDIPRVRFLWRFYDSAGANGVSVVSPFVLPSWAGVPFESVASVPDGKTLLQIYVEIQDARAGWVELQNPKLELMTGSTLIEDGAITTEKIATGAITAESGVVGSLDAGTLTSGYVDADRIRAHSLDADLVLVAGSAGATVITDGAITTEKIATGAITADSGVVGSLDAGKIAVGQMDGARIKSGSVTTDKILVGAPTNLLPDLGAAIATGNTDNLAPWKTPGYGINTIDPSFFLPGGDTVSRMIERVFLIEMGTRYRFACDVKSTRAGGVFFWQIMGDDDEPVAFSDWQGGGDRVYPFNAQKTTVAGAFQSFESSGVARRTRICRLRIWLNNPLGVDQAGGYMWIMNARIEPMTGSTLIEDGAITTEKIATGAITADSGVVGSLDAGKITVGELDGARIKANTIGADHLTASAIDGKIITGATIQTRASNPKTMLDAQGIHITSADGSDIVNLTADPSTGGNYLGILAPNGETLANVSDTGVIAGQTLNLIDDATIMGIPLLGDLATYESPTKTAPRGWLDQLPRGLVARNNQTNISGWTCDNGAMAIGEIATPMEAGRRYIIDVGMPALRVYNTRCDIEIRWSTSRASLSSTLAYQHPLDARGTTQDYTNFKETISLPFSASETRVYYFLILIRTIGVAKVADGYNCVINVTDIGLDIEETGNRRTDNTSKGQPEPPSPPEPAIRNYTKKYRPTNGTAYYVGSGNKRTQDRQYFYQGDQPGTGDMRSLLMFPNMTPDLSGAKITGMRAHYEFTHWYYNSGGTARLWFHDRLTTPDTLANASFKRLMTKTNIPRPGSVTVDIPPSWWNEFKTGALRGMGFGNETGTRTEYGYGYWDRCWIEVKYLK